MGRLLRYTAPNLVTTIGLMFGLLAVVATHEHRYADAAWLIIWAVLLDRVDGLIARLLKSTSDFGMQMDSFADFFNFGCAPAFLIFVSLGSSPQLGFVAGTGRVILLIACMAWVLGNLFRLARFNVVSESAGPDKPSVFFGVPTTLAAGTLAIWYLLFLKYAGPASPIVPDAPFRGPMLLDWEVGVGVWRYFPAAMLVGSVLMVSNLPVPKLGRLRSGGMTMVLFATVLLGYVLGFAKLLPEAMVWMPTTWLVVCLTWGQFSKQARSLEPPPLFGRRGAPPEADEEEDEDLVDLEEDFGRQRG